MYQEFFALNDKPFALTSNPSFLYLSPKHKEALAYLAYGIRERMGFIEITGEVGTGKTTIIRSLLNQLDDKTKTAFIFNSSLTELQLMQTVIEDLGIQTQKKGRAELFSELNRYLIEQLRQNNNVVLIIDEAQNLSMKLLEQVRMLSNLEADNEKLLQIVLVGQPELRDKLARPELRQLRQRISVRYHIDPLDHADVPRYISHRLAVAGAVNGKSPVFLDKALDEIGRYSGGVPRLINSVCDKALLMAYVLEERQINADIVKRCIREIEGGVS